MLTSALRPVNRAIVDVAAHSRLENGLCDGRLEQVVLTRLEVTEAVSEYVEGFADRRVHHDLMSNARRRFGWGRFLPLLDRSISF